MTDLASGIQAEEIQHFLLDVSALFQVLAFLLAVNLYTRK